MEVMESGKGVSHNVEVWIRETNMLYKQVHTNHLTHLTL